MVDAVELDKDRKRGAAGSADSDPETANGHRENDGLIPQVSLVWFGFGQVLLDVNRAKWPKLLSNLAKLTEGTIIDRRPSPKTTHFYGHVGLNCLNSFWVLRLREGTILVAKWCSGEAPRRVFCLFTSAIAMSYGLLGIYLPGLLFSKPPWSAIALVTAFMLVSYAACVHTNRFLVGRLPQTLTALLVPGTVVNDLPRRSFWSFF